ncbi:MAG: SRPBCC domain-containing protein [Chitinophaga sp.]|uniref:SRPBCC family protein n=1 Tax=Chitinophaga sp. TaxID=1869181 RepID=UPI001B182CF4|nr:SRPBCC domain-containing protein [Chitinophaga sp.]MBO9732687.1 SRPBCC domain-containing protein [Chitinophaga sp.]
MAKQIEVTKVFHAPIDMVWQVWVDPELVKRWWGPKDFISPVADIDFREGGKSLVSMRAPKEMGEKEWYSIWEYVKIIPFEKIEFIQNLADKDGNKTEPTKVGMPADFPTDIRTVVVFRPLGDDSTEMTVTEYAEFGSMSHFAQLGLEQSMQKVAVIFQ